MKQVTIWSTTFFILLGLNLLGNFYSVFIIAHLSKVLLMPVLAGLFLNSGITHKNSPLSRWTFFALLFSWGGDLLLIFQDLNTNFFLLGLASFLLAHICYILLYRKARDSSNVIVNWSYWAVILAILVAYLFLLFIKIGVGLGTFLVPVIVYAITISLMLLTSFSRIGRTTRVSFLYIVFGSSFFVLSDSLIALNKFSHSVLHSGVFIMLNYGVAQYLIIKGIMKHRLG